MNKEVLWLRDTLPSSYMQLAQLGVKFGLICIQKDIPVADIADYFKVSRMTVYNWFKGVTAMPEKHEGAVAKLSGWIT